MTIPTSGLPLFWMGIAATLTIFGSLAALRALAAIASERKKIRRAKIALNGNESWVGALAEDEIALSTWLRSRGIAAESCIGDFIRACWSAWFVGRAASLTELHVLVVRRERTRASARFSAGIAGLLLVVGIVGTLSSIHPVLKAFQFQVSASGELQDVAESTQLVNSLINNLGDAFWPSLVALGGTIIVVFLRGCYLLSLHKFTLALDQFAIDVLIPQYKPSSISGEYQQVKQILTDLSDGISRREENFGSVITELQELVVGITPAIEALKNTAEQTDKAAKNLSARSESIADGITKNLGAKSPIYQAITGFEGIFERANKSIEDLKIEISKVGDQSRTDQKSLRDTANQLGPQIKKINDDHTSNQEKATNLLTELESTMGEAPKAVEEAGRKAADKGIQVLEQGLKGLREDQKKEATTATTQLKEQASATLEQIKKDTSATLGEIVSDTKAIPKAAEDLKQALSERSKIEEAAITAIQVQQKESQQALTEPIATLNNAAAKVTNAVDRISENLDRPAGGTSAPPSGDTRSTKHKRGFFRWATGPFRWTAGLFRRRNK